MINAKTIAILEDHLINDENTSDAELREIFTRAYGLTQEEATTWLGKRAYYSGKGYLDDMLALARQMREAPEGTRTCRNCNGICTPLQAHRTQEGAWVCQQCFLDNLPV